MLRRLYYVLLDGCSIAMKHAETIDNIGTTTESQLTLYGEYLAARTRSCIHPQLESLIYLDVRDPRQMIPATYVDRGASVLIQQTY